MGWTKSKLVDVKRAVDGENGREEEEKEEARAVEHTEALAKSAV